MIATVGLGAGAGVALAEIFGDSGEGREISLSGENNALYAEGGQLDDRVDSDRLDGLLSDQKRQANAANSKATYNIVGVGDMMLGSDWPSPRMDSRVSPGADPADVLGAGIAQLLRSADVTFGNFEGTLHSSSSGAKYCRNPSVCYTFRSPEFHADYLKRAGFSMLSNANNHARDFGEGGRKKTYDNLTSAGFVVSAADKDGMRFGVQKLDDGTTVALVAFGHNPGLMAVQNLPRVTSLVKQADELADIVVVSCHIGAEGRSKDRLTRSTEMFLGENRGNPYAFAHTAVDAGADVVFCHGPHIPRAIEVYKDRFIAYSLGNFWTYGRFSLTGTSGMSPIADLQVGADGSLKKARIVSAKQLRPGGPSLDPSGAAAAQIARLTARDIPEAGISIDSEGNVSW